MSRIAGGPQLLLQCDFLLGVQVLVDGFEILYDLVGVQHLLFSYLVLGDELVVQLEEQELSIVHGLAETHLLALRILHCGGVLEAPVRVLGQHRGFGGMKQELHEVDAGCPSVLPGPVDVGPETELVQALVQVLGELVAVLERGPRRVVGFPA